MSIYSAKSERKAADKKFNANKKANLNNEEMAYNEIQRAINIKEKPEYFCFRGIL